MIISEMKFMTALFIKSHVFKPKLYQDHLVYQSENLIVTAEFREN